jgi:integrase
MATRMNFTKAALESLPVPDKGKRIYYLDDGGSKSVRGLGLTVFSTGVKSFYVMAYFQGSSRRVGFAKFPDLSVENARKKAKQLISDIAQGENPIQKKKAEKSAEVTLRQVYEDYIANRKSLKPGTLLDYEKSLKQTFPDWLDKPMVKITKDMVRRRHTKRGKESHARANNAMRVLRALFNYATEVYEDDNGESLFPLNPVTVLSRTKAWHRVNRKKTYISKEDLPKWFEAVERLESRYSYSKVEVIKDYILFILFTGVRREEAAQLKWSEVDLKEKTFTLLDTKNGEDVTLPMSDYVVRMITVRKTLDDGEFVFPGDGKTGHIADVRKQIMRVREKSGVIFTLHDLRRTFLTIAEGLDISQYTLKRLVNHKAGENSDVTAGYIVVDIERLRKASQRVTNTILKIAGRRKGEVIDIRSKVNRAS